MKLGLKVVPGASRDAIVGWLGEQLKVCVRAKPEQGKANAAVEKLLAKSLQLPKDCVQIVAGKTKSRKTVELAGLNEDTLRERVSALLD